MLYQKFFIYNANKSVYGWQAFTRLQKEFRKKPLGNYTDAEKAAQFVYMMCFVTRNDLVPFFKKWGLNIDAATAQRIAAMRLPLPKTDPSTIFK